MARETKNKRNGAAADVGETLLTRRLADDLDAFLENADDETFLLTDEPNASSRRGRSVKSPRFKALAAIAASTALLCGVASTLRVYNASPVKENFVETQRPSDEPSLVAWSVENWGDSEWARHVETQWTRADVFGFYAASSAEVANAEANEAEEAAERFAEVEKETVGQGSDAAEIESNDWFSVETLSGVAAREPLKYEPFLQVVVATLQ